VSNVYVPVKWLDGWMEPSNTWFGSETSVMVPAIRKVRDAASEGMGMATLARTPSARTSLGARLFIGGLRSRTSAQSRRSIRIR